MTQVSDAQYRDNMDQPVESLALTLWGINGPQNFMLDHEIVGKAGKKIHAMKLMLIECGYSAEVIQAILES
jgi:hypothetical protein